MSSILRTTRVAVVGLGQLGASLAWRLKQLDCREVFGIARREESLVAAVEGGMIDAGSTEPEEVLGVVDLVFLCLPLDATIPFVEKNLHHFRFGSMVTDVGSTKLELVEKIRPQLFERGVWFIGGHPMAGSERSGMAAAAPDLYNGCTVFLTPTPEDDPDALELLRTFWKELGSVPIEIDAARHDAAVGGVSHALHLLAAAIVNANLESGDVDARSMAAAGSFRDMTRVAASDPALWTAVCDHNRDGVLQAIDAITERLAAMREAVSNHDRETVQKELATAAELRTAWFDSYTTQRRQKEVKSE
jgi:prephenate dehydrogenase